MGKIHPISSYTVAAMKRRSFLKRAISVPALGAATSLAGQVLPAASSHQSKPGTPRDHYTPGRIPNEYNLLLPGEREVLRNSPRVTSIRDASVSAGVDGESKTLKAGESIAGWQLVAILPWLNGVATAVFEKHVTHQGAIAYVTEAGEIASVPKRVGDLSKIRPRPTDTPHFKQFERVASYVPGPDVFGNHILNSAEDPGYENVAALGAEMIGWTLVANEESAPQKSLWIEADGKSRQFGTNADSLWAPDLTGRLFDPRLFLPSEYLYEYVHGYSKRTLLGGYLPAADIGVWNPKFKLGYEVMVVLPPGPDAHPMGRIRAMVPHAADADAAKSSPAFTEQYWNCTAEEFFDAVAGLWNKWRHFFEDRMKVEVPDEWLLDAARAGIVLSRCSYHGLEPTYQIGEGAYTKFPVRSHALFPVAHYEFVWAHQLWNLTDEVEPYFEHYLNHYILDDGNFTYNTQDQVEAPLNAGVFLENSARAYDYTQDIAGLRRRLPVLRKMMDYVRRRYRYSKENFPPDDPRHGLIWGSPEADNGEPNNDFPESHPFYYQNAAWIWRGLHEHSRCLQRAGDEHQDDDLRREAAEVAGWAASLRADIEHSLAKTLSDRNAEMKQAGITPFTPFDTARKPTELSSYENHRYMMDWWTSDWGDVALDNGHFKHRELAGQQILGMNTSGNYPRTSNFMEHGTLAGRIRQDDYRPFLLALYGNLCYAMDSGNRYSPEDALLPGSFPGEGSPYGWSAVVNSELQPTLALRWLLCYEEHDGAIHLQKAVPKHWFTAGEAIRVQNCPTRSGPISWTTVATAAEGNGAKWNVEIKLPPGLAVSLKIHIHPPNREPLRSTTLGILHPDHVEFSPSLLAGKTKIKLEIA